MSGGNDELLNAFITEASEGLADIENDFLKMEENGDNVDLDLVNKIFRAIHSMKGSSGFLGLKSIGLLAHEMETALNLIRGGDLIPTPTVVEALLKGADALSEMVRNIEDSESYDVSGHLDAIKKAIAGETSEETQESLNRDVDVELPDGGGLVFMLICEQELVSRQRNGQSIYVLDVDMIGDVHDRGRTPLEFLKSLYQCGELIDSYISTAGVGGLDEDLPDKLSLMLLVASKLDREELEAALEIPQDCIHFIASPEETDWTTGTPKSPMTPVSTPVQTDEHAAPKTSSDIPAITNEASARPETSPTSTPPAIRPTQASTSLRVNVGLLDTLMNLAGELVLARNQLVQILDTSDRANLESAAAGIDQITSELQEAIMQTRMQPIGNVFSKFPRIVRDLSKSLGKECELTIEGKDVELDKSIVEAIGDPLTHLVRNSVDHGVETPTVRDAAGKPAVGNIILRAFHQAGKVLISISDDGKGIDPSVLRRKAVDKEIYTSEQARALSDRDAVQLIFHPGFSTAEEVTDVSGRGVGMDVVKTNIENLGGNVEVDTEIGRGTTVTVKLPLTLAIIPSLVVICSGDRFAIPQVNISELVRVKRGEVAARIQKVKNAEVLRLRGSLLPLVRLSSVLSMPTFAPEKPESHTAEPPLDSSQCAPENDASSARNIADSQAERDIHSALNIIVVEAGHIRYGLIVDALHDSEEIVVKPLGRHMKESECLAGATILGDGKVALILDIAGIASHANLMLVEDEELEDLSDEARKRSGDTQPVLLFTNDPHEQFAAPMPLIARIERISTNQIDSVGGQEVLQYRGGSLSLLSLEDCIKAKPKPDKKQVYVVVFSLAGKEIGLVAPELVDIRNVPTEIDTVTFKEPGVLGSVIVDDRATRLIDIFGLADAVHPDWFEKRATTTTSTGGKPNILLAEDSGFFRGQIMKFLEAGNYDVEGCEDGLIAWNALQDPEKRFDMVITDIEMPNMNGLELAAKIKSDPMFAHLPVIAVTSLAGEEDIERGKRAGVDAYHIKLDREKLLVAVADALKEAKLKAGSAAGGSLMSSGRV